MYLQQVQLRCKVTWHRSGSVFQFMTSCLCSLEIIKAKLSRYPEGALYTRHGSRCRKNIVQASTTRFIEIWNRGPLPMFYGWTVFDPWLNSGNEIPWCLFAKNALRKQFIQAVICHKNTSMSSWSKEYKLRTGVGISRHFWTDPGWI